MIRNVIQMREHIMLWIDYINSPRFSDKQYNTLLNSAILKIVDDKYYNEKQKKPYSFQSIQTLRDQLQNLVVKYTSLTITNDKILQSSYPTNYYHLLALKVQINGNWYSCKPTSYDEINIFEKDPNAEPQIIYPDRVYFIEDVDGLQIYHGSEYTVDNAEMYYLAIPQKINFGWLWTVADGNFVITEHVIANEETVYMGGPHEVGDEFPVTAGNSLTSGSVYRGWTDHNMSESLEDTICQLAGSYLLKTVGDLNQDIILERETIK